MIEESVFIKKYTRAAKSLASKVHGKKHICRNEKNHQHPAFQHKKSPLSLDLGLFGLSDGALNSNPTFAK